MAVQNLGIPIDLSKGTFVNTEYVNNTLKLKTIGTTLNGNPVYVDYGYWESNVIDLVDKFTDFDTIAISKIIAPGASYVISTKSSDNGINWENYIPISDIALILSTPARYFKVKIELFSGKNVENTTIYSFQPEDKSLFQNNEFVEFNNGLSLKKDYSYIMNKDNSWSEEGQLFKIAIPKSQFKKIDTIEQKDV